MWSAAWLSVCCVFDFQRFDSGVGQFVWCRCHHGVGSFGPFGWHCLDGYRGAWRFDHHVLRAELWRAQLRAHAQGLPHVARSVVYAHWWPVCRAAGVLGSVVASVCRRCFDFGVHHDDSSFYRAVLRDLLDYRKRVGLHSRCRRELAAHAAHDFWHRRAQGDLGVCDYAVRSVA